jgi:hypothetical protein
VKKTVDRKKSAVPPCVWKNDSINRHPYEPILEEYTINDSFDSLFQFFGYSQYWNERCAITVAWEEANGITMKQKKKTIKVSIDEPARIVVQAKTLKRPSSKKEEN